jgi:lipoyl(octanoyl) transferase
MLSLPSVDCKLTSSRPNIGEGTRPASLAKLFDEIPMNSLQIVDLGLVSYTDAYALQQRVVAARKAGDLEDVLLLCEHPHVITLGRNGKRENLLASDHVLRQKNVEFHSANRGGDITYHGPGQLVGYPILDLSRIKQDVHWYVRTLEEVMIRATADFDISAYRIPGKTGIWVEVPPAEEKLAAIGVHISRWVTSHGFAYNVATDLRYFDLIIPCGINDRKATSLEKLLSRGVSLSELKPRMVRHFADLFGFRTQTVSKNKLNAISEKYAIKE